MYHYVYYSYEEWGRGYIGVRSCQCPPEEDCSYFGSYKDKTFAPTSKIILQQFDTRESAIAAEVALHMFYKVHVNPHFANIARQTSSKFDCPTRSETHRQKIGEAVRGEKHYNWGRSLSNEVKQKIREANTGKKRSEECKQKHRRPKSEEHKKAIGNALRGKKRTPEQNERMRKAKKGKVPKSAIQKWQCTVTGKISNAGALSVYQRNRGIDTSNRLRLPDNEQSYTEPDNN
jgi:hypothetical protein